MSVLVGIGPWKSRAHADQDRHPGMSETGPAEPVWPAVGAGLPLAVPGVRLGRSRVLSLAAMTELPDIRELAEIPAVEVITRSAVMLMSAAAEKLGLSAEDPDESPHRDLDEAPG